MKRYKYELKIVFYHPNYGEQTHYLSTDELEHINNVIRRHKINSSKIISVWSLVFPGDIPGLELTEESL